MEEKTAYPLELKEGNASPRPLSQHPEIVLQEAQKAAKVLQRVVALKSKPVIFRGEQYLEFEDWQTVGKFYGLCARTLEAEPVEIFRVKGAKAKAEVLDLRSGQIVGGAEAYCMRDEENWRDKPWFQLASMTQTRAEAKALRNVLAWVVVVAGYRPTPAEELPQTQSLTLNSRPQTTHGGDGGPSHPPSPPRGNPSGNQTGSSQPKGEAKTLSLPPIPEAQPRMGDRPKIPQTGKALFKLPFPLPPKPQDEKEGDQESGKKASPSGNGFPSPEERPTREDYIKLLKAALNCGFVTLDKNGKKAVDYHHLGQFLKSVGLPPRVREMNREQCYMATLSLETYSRYLFPGRE